MLRQASNYISELDARQLATILVILMGVTAIVILYSALCANERDGK